ncbi:MAG: N-acetylmuramoyl-L-alanine amidase [Pseudomonadota bacterium]
MRAVRAVLLTAWAVLGPSVAAQDLSGLARALPDETRLEASRNAVELRLSLSQGVPYRAYTLTDPPQLVLELSEVNWAGFDPSQFAQDRVGTMQVGTLAPGWSGLVLGLDGPFAIKQTAISLGEDRATLMVALARVSEAEFAAASGMPDTSAALLRGQTQAAPRTGDAVVVIDPGHGGVDPGAERGGVRESDLTLLMARELREGLRRAGGFEVHMTRDADVFVSLEARAALARELRADVFISLHADALDENDGYAEGATAYSLADEATDAASALLAERHNRGRIIGGVNLGGQEDEIARVLLDLARADTAPRSERLAVTILDALQDQGARLNSNPQRAADFAVLRSADVPSVLIEVGFLSSQRDRIELQSPERRGRIISGLVRGLDAWVEADRADRALLRQ